MNPYFCSKCNRNHVKGKIFDEHREFAVDLDSINRDAAREEDKKDFANYSREEQENIIMENLKDSGIPASEIREIIQNSWPDIDLGAITPGMTMIETSSGIMEIIRDINHIPISLFDPTDRTMRANLKEEQWEWYEPDPCSPDGRELITKPFSLCEKIKYGKEIARSQGKKYGFFQQIAHMRTWKKFCKENDSNATIRQGNSQ